MIARIQSLSGNLTIPARALLLSLYRVLFSFVAYHVARQVIDDDARQS
jgi:hypothetical protein